MTVRPQFWDEMERRYGKRDDEIAAALGVSANYVYRVRKGTRQPGNRFFDGARRALPGLSLDFFFPADPPATEAV